ncbi:MAG: hypothetical protein ACJAVV_003178 [Alphaproteobacteria bacterium]|jgi:hypothetical protein
MKPILSALLALSALAVSATSFASSNTDGETKAFNCMDKKTFEINSGCISQNIESNLVFQKAEKAVLVNADNASDRALATMTFNSRTMTINIVAHKDATIANIDTAKLKTKR